MNYIRRLKNRKGFTLVELIVVIALVAIIVVCVAAFSTPVKSMVKGSAARSDAITINKIIGDYIDKRVSFAEQVEIYLNCDGTNNQEHITGNGSFADILANCNPSHSRGAGGALVIRYVTDTENHKSTYKLYDIPYNVAWPAGPAWSNYMVYDDAFYSGYEFLINMDETSLYRYCYGTGLDNDGDGFPDPDEHGNIVNPYLYNKGKGKFYLNFEITSFNFTADSGNSLDGALAADTAIKLGTGTAADQTLVDTLYREKTGKENISLMMNNMKLDQSDPSRIVPQNRFKVFGFNTSEYIPGKSGSDIVIFYRTKYYE